MFNKEYRAINITDKKTKDVEFKLDQSGIDRATYRINHFSTQKEIVAEITVSKKIKTIIG